MRFCIAAAAVLATVESTTTSSFRDPVAVFQSQNRVIWREARNNRLNRSPHHRRLSNNSPSKRGPIKKRRHHKRQEQSMINDTTTTSSRRLLSVPSTGRPRLSKTECDPYSPDVGILSCGVTQFCKESHASKQGGFCTDIPSVRQRSAGVSKSIRLTNNKMSQECVPNSHHLSTQNQDVPIDADIGILSMCGSRQHCQKHSDSTLGGFCVDSDTSTNQRGNKIWNQLKRQSTSTSSTAIHVHNENRKLQSGVDPNFEEELGFDFVASNICNNANYTCSTCSYGDDAAERVFECTYAEDYCGMEVDDFCGGGDGIPVCYNYVLAGQQTDESQELTFCLKLVQPAQLEYCYTKILTGSDEYSCAFSVNGQACNSCTIAAPQQETDCFIFDCENTDLPISGNTCTYDFDGLVTRTIEQVILPCEGGCTLCKEGEIISNVNAIVSLEQGDASCGAVAISALTGDGPFADPAYCASLNTLAGEICGCYNPTEGVYIPSNNTDTVSPVAAPVTTPTDAPTEEDNESIMLLNIIDEICADGSGYTCSTCEVDMVARTATFDCAVPEYCENRPSFCTKPLNFCMSHTFQGSITSDDVYGYEFCSTIKTTPIDEVYQFDYCITYNTSPDDDSCKIEIDGIECTSCTMNYSDETQISTASFDCRNTLLGRMGENFRALYVMDETEGYFAYRALPCPGGCNLCGDDDDARMTNLTATFTITKDDTVPEQVCSEAQLAALIGPTDTSFCEEMQASVRGPCQCQDPSSSTPSPTPAPAPDNLGGSGGQSLGVSNTLLATTAVMMVGAIFLFIQ